MKTKEKIEQLANELIGTQFCGQINITDEVKEFYINGYTQCQEDMDKKYTEEDLHTILRLRKEWYSHTDKNVVRDFIQSLNKQE